MARDPFHGDISMWQMTSQYFQHIYTEQEAVRFQHSLEHEEAILNAVQQGDSVKVKALKEEDRCAFAVDLSFEMQKYLCVYTVTLCTWAAIHGGISEEEAFMLHSAMLIRLSHFSSKKEIQDFPKQACMEFAEFVRTHSDQCASTTVKKIKSYISLHLSEPIKINEIAQAVGMHRNSLSALFKASEGYTIPEYIRQEKMKEARYLLCCTDQDISSVAATLGFSSQSHFGAIFKQTFGITPKKYRENFLSLCIFDKNC